MSQTFEERLEAFIRKVEKAAHKAGWDQSPALLIRVTEGSLGLTGDEMRLDLLDGNPRNALAMVADFYENAPQHVLGTQKEWGMDPSVAHVFITEMYMRNGDTDPGTWESAGYSEEAMIAGLKRKYGTSRFADIPGSIEGRMVLGAYGHDGEMMTLMRKRFEEPAFWPYEKDMTLGGAVTDSLLRIQAVREKA